MHMTQNLHQLSLECQLCFLEIIWFLPTGDGSFTICSAARRRPLMFKFNSLCKNSSNTEAQINLSIHLFIKSAALSGSKFNFPRGGASIKKLSCGWGIDFVSFLTRMLLLPLPFQIISH